MYKLEDILTEFEKERAALDISILKLCELAGIAEKTYHNLKINPTIATLGKIRIALDNLKK